LAPRTACCKIGLGLLSDCGDIAVGLRVGIKVRLWNCCSISVGVLWLRLGDQKTPRNKPSQNGIIFSAKLVKWQYS